MTISVRHEVTINAPIAAVWKEVIDLPGWKKWSKWTVLEGMDTAQVGPATLQASFDGDGVWKKFACNIAEVDHASYLLRWTGKVAGGCLFDGNHWMSFKETSPGVTTMYHCEDFNGMLPALGIGMPFKKVDANYLKMCQALKAHVEGGGK
eukprot:CAMPEP_0172020944 /NCGR_PEP_ID=MMETSP1041-20130122/13453_1 /TAXON_ID=464988 /ORGANISM="Hemiselmis andersenii, Strain CCMP439" /LENGTH=149 /DNA_ID=CAMNT_0012676245 /DNA_START=89 /DNA_END=538 /DNA_ORIENTATION=-